MTGVPDLKQTTFFMIDLPVRADTIPALHDDLAYNVAAWEPYNLHDVDVACVGSVVCRSCTQHLITADCYYRGT